MILSVKGLHFRYNSHSVLNDVHFQLERGQILGVLGVNGAGKSTLLKCMNRILKPHLGSILLDGADLMKLGRNDIAKRVGYVPQRFGEERLSVFDTVLLGRKPYIRWAPTKRDFDVVESVLGLMGLADFALRPVNELSGGETQKVVIARALAQEPDVMLLDEPTSNLDLKNQMEVMTLVSSAVRERSISAIISVHDLNLALRFGDYFAMLKDGTIHAFTRKESVTPEVIHEVFGVNIIMSEIQGYPFIIPLPPDVPAPKCCTTHPSDQ